MPFMKFALRKTTNGKLLFVVVSGYSNFWLCHSASRNTPASFQAFMSAILSDFTGVCAFVYLDDILVFSPSEEQHKLDVNSNSRGFGLLSPSTESQKVHIASVRGFIPWQGWDYCPTVKGRSSVILAHFLRRRETFAFFLASAIFIVNL
jgi:hypothetical protein